MEPMKLIKEIDEYRRGEVTVEQGSAEDRSLKVAFATGRPIQMGKTYESLKGLGFKKAVYVVRGKVHLSLCTVKYMVGEVK